MPPPAGADIVEAAPACEHAGIAAVAASHTACELVTLLARRAGGPGETGE